MVKCPKYHALVSIHRNWHESIVFAARPQIRIFIYEERRKSVKKHCWVKHSFVVILFIFISLNAMLSSWFIVMYAGIKGRSISMKHCSLRYSCLFEICEGRGDFLSTDTISTQVNRQAYYIIYDNELIKIIRGFVVCQKDKSPAFHIVSASALRMSNWMENKKKRWASLAIHIWHSRCCMQQREEKKWNMKCTNGNEYEYFPSFFPLFNTFALFSFLCCLSFILAELLRWVVGKCQLTMQFSTLKNAMIII